MFEMDGGKWTKICKFYVARDRSVKKTARTLMWKVLTKERRNSLEVGGISNLFRIVLLFIMHLFNKKKAIIRAIKIWISLIK